MTQPVHTPSLRVELPVLTGLTTAAALVMSVIYDHGFFRALNLGLASVPTTISDHVRSAIVWAPTFLVAIFLSGVLALPFFAFLSRVPPGPATRPEPIFSIGVQILIGVILCGALAAKYPAGALIYPVLMSAWAILILAAAWRGKNWIRKKALSKAHVLMAFTIPMICTLVGLLGYIHGFQMLQNRAVAWEVTLKNDQSVERVKVVGLRRFGTFAVLITPDRLIRLVPDAHAQVTAVLALEPNRTTSLLCSLGVAC
jgi:hypothetical protein